APDVRRQRDVADVLDRLEHRSPFAPQPDRTPAVEVTREDLGVQTYAVALEDHACAGLELLAGMDERLPFLGIGALGRDVARPGWLPVRLVALARRLSVGQMFIRGETRVVGRK